MSVILSIFDENNSDIYVSCFFSMYYIGYDALQVGRFWHVKEDRVVLRLAALLEDAHLAACVGCSGAKHPLEFGFADVERAGAGDEDASGPQHLQGAEVELLVAAQRGRHGAFGFGEGGRVEDDGVVLASGGSVVLEQVEGVGLDPFDLAAAVLSQVELLIPLGDFQRGTRRVNRGHALAHARQVQREAALVGEAIERLTMAIAGGSSVVFALVEEGASLLSGKSVEVKAHAVHGEEGARPLAAYQLRLSRRQLLQLADVRLNPLEHAGLRKMLG